MTIKTVVAVSYGDSGFGQPISCEVFTRDRQSLSPGELSQMVAAHSPQPGDLDDPAVVRRRYSRLREMGGHVEAVPSHAIEMAERVTGNSGREVLDADYREPIGQVLAFDAEVDDETGEVNWYTAMPHPETNPYSLAGPGAENKIYRRADGALLSMAHLASGEHKVAMDRQNHNIPVNEFDQVVQDLTDADWAMYNKADLSGLSRETMVVCARKAPDGYVKVTCQRLEDVAASGELLDPLKHGFYSRAMDHEAVREQSGDNQRMIRDPQGNPLWVGVIEAGCGEPLRSHQGNRPMDALGSSPSPVDVPAIQTQVARDGRLLVSFEEELAAGAGVPVQADPTLGAMLGGYAPKPTPVGQGPLHMGTGPRPEPGAQPLRPMAGHIPPGPLNMGQHLPGDRLRGEPGETPAVDAAGGSGVLKAAGMGAAGGIVSSALSGQRKRSDLFASPDKRTPSGSPSRVGSPQSFGSAARSAGFKPAPPREAAAPPQPARSAFGAAAGSAGFMSIGPSASSPQESSMPRSSPQAQSFGAAARSAGFGGTPQATSAQDLLSGAPTGAQASRPRPLAGMNASVRNAAARYGPQLVESAKTTLNDPQVRTDLKKVARVGVEAAIMAKGGGKLRAGAAVHAVGQLKDLPTVDRVRGLATRHGLSGVADAGRTDTPGQSSGQQDRRSSGPEL